MTYPTWPAELDHVLVEGYRSTFANNTMRRKTESGPPMARRRYSRNARMMAIPLMLSLDQKYRLERFWYEELKEGASYFYIENPEIAGIEVADDDEDLITTRDGDTLSIGQTLIVLAGEGDLEFTPTGGLDYRVTIELAVMP